MHVYTTVLLVAVSAYAIARPIGPTTAGPAASSEAAEGFPDDEDVPEILLPPFTNELPFKSKYILPQYIGFQEASPRLSLPSRSILNDWLATEIEKIMKLIHNSETLRPYLNNHKQYTGSDQWTTHVIGYPQEGPIVSKSYTNNNYSPDDDGHEDISKYAFINEPWDYVALTIGSPTESPIIEEDVTPNRGMAYTGSNPDAHQKKPTDDSRKTTESTFVDNSRPLETSKAPSTTSKTTEQNLLLEESQTKIRFAFIPTDKEYFENLDKEHQNPKAPHDSLGKKIQLEGGDGGYEYSMLIDQRPIRQNPNLSKQKHLLEPDLGKLQLGLATKDYRMPVSLLPTNLRWLKVNQKPADIMNNRDDSSPDQDQGYYMGALGPHPVQVSKAAEPDSLYRIALITTAGLAVTITSFGIVTLIYSLMKKSKMAADVDYPAYGVTGPSIDNSGDRKLAHSAHMYHYQHQKQQIIAMERAGLEQRTGSNSDIDSEEENEEGDYTVYECPGFATTGEMEVKNPLFSGDPTLASPPTPCKCQIVKPQPKN